MCNKLTWAIMLSVWAYFLRISFTNTEGHYRSDIQVVTLWHLPSLSSLSRRSLQVINGKRLNEIWFCGTLLFHSPSQQHHYLGRSKGPLYAFCSFYHCIKNQQTAGSTGGLSSPRYTNHSITLVKEILSWIQA